MRAGRLKTKRYPVRGGRKAVFFVLGVLLLILAFFAVRANGGMPFLHFSSPVLSPEESVQETKTLTLPGRTWYALQLGAFETEEMARSFADAYRARGAAGFIDRSDHFRVLAAAYDSRAAAQAVQSQLGALHGVEAYVSEITRPEVQLRLTGQRAQLTALCDAYDALNNAAEKAYALSRGLDGRSMERQEILLSLTSEKETALALKSRLADLFGKDAPEAVAFIVEALNELSAALENALSASGDTALGAQVKYIQLFCIERMAAYARLLRP